MVIRTESGRVLLAIDGEAHSDNAIQGALELADDFQLEVVAVHVNDHYVKQFFNEIYAQGREEYLEHVQACLEVNAREAIARFETEARKYDIKWTIKVLEGDPAEQIQSEIHSFQYNLMVLGRKQNRGSSLWRSRDLPEKLLSARNDVPILIIPQ